MTKFLVFFNAFAGYCCRLKEIYSKADDWILLKALSSNFTFRKRRRRRNWFFFLAGFNLWIFLSFFASQLNGYHASLFRWMINLLEKLRSRIENNNKIKMVLECCFVVFFGLLALFIIWSFYFNLNHFEFGDEIFRKECRWSHFCVSVCANKSWHCGIPMIK